MSASRWEVACADYSVPATSREGAERRMAEIERLGACPFAHEVREVER